MSTTNNIEGNQNNFGDIKGGTFIFNYSAKKDININNINIPKRLILRTKMLEEIQKAYENVNDDNNEPYDCVVISGIGGSGKTSLAYLYAREHKFNNVTWVTVNGKIEDAFLDKIAGLLFTGKGDYESFTKIDDKKTIFDVIKSEFSKIQGNNLLVFDINTNNEAIKQEIETKINNYLPTSKNWKTLVLTRVFAENRSRFASIKMDNAAVPDSQEMLFAQELFLKNWTRNKIEFSQDKLAKITKELYYHPLLIEQTAIVFSKGHEKTADEIITKIKENSKINNPRTEKIVSGLAIEDKELQNICTYLINLCNIENLSDDEVKFLAVYVTWPEEPIDYEVIETLLLDSEVVLESLEGKGILSRNDFDQYFIHSLMADVLREQIIHYKELDYTDYLANISNLLSDNDSKEFLRKYSKYIAYSFIKNSICDDVDLFIHFLNQLCITNDSTLYSFSKSEYLKSLDKMKEKANDNSELMAGLYNVFGMIEKSLNNLSDAKQFLNNALSVIENCVKNSYNLNFKATILNNIGMVDIEQNCFADANDVINRALKIRNNLTDIPNITLYIATDLNNLALAEEKLGEYENAKNHLKEALQFREKIQNPNSEDNINEIATILNNLAYIEENQNNFDIAANLYIDALNKRNKLSCSIKNMDAKANIFNNIAGLKRRQNDTDMAKKYYVEALFIRNNIDNTLFNLNEKAIIFSNLGELEHYCENYTSAKRKYKIALKIRVKLPKTPNFLNNLAIVLNNFAGLEDCIGEYDSSKKHYNEALNIRKNLPLFPENSDNMAVIYYNLADLEQKLGDTDSAKKHFEEGLEISRQINNERYINAFEEKLSNL